MIDQTTVDRIVDAANIVDVVSDFVTLKKRGVNYVGLCPFHDDKTPSFYVSASKGICKCFSCGKGGSSVYFIMEHEQMSYYEALKFLAKKYNIEINERELTDEERRIQNDRESMLIVNTFAQNYFTNTLFNHLEGKSVGLSYFHERGFRDDIIRKFALGYSLEQRDALAKEAERNGYKNEYLLKTGLCLENQHGGISDRFRGRVIFPVFSLSGKVLAFGGRILKKDEKTAKYLNSPESEIYHKSNELYGLYHAKQAIVKNDCCFLVEGYTDVLSMHQAGIENVVASSGTALTPGQIKLIHRFTNNITVLYDGDAAGIKASIRGIDLLLKEGMNIKVVLLPEGEDPDSFSKGRSAGEFTEYIRAHETDFIRFKTNLLIDGAGEDPIKRAALINDIVQSIAIIPDNIIRSVYTKECCRLLEIREEVLLREINTLRLNQIQTAQSDANYSSEKSNAENQEQPAPVTENKEEPILRKSISTDRFELAIIRYIVRYGNDLLFQDTDENGNEETWKVTEYIQQDLLQDEIVFRHPLYKFILDEAVKLQNVSTEQLQRHFIAHINPEVSQITVNLISEKHQLSKYHSKFQSIETEKDRLQELIPRSLFELKDAIIDSQIKDTRDALKKGNHLSSEEKQEIMQELIALYKIKTTLSKEIGDRIVYPRR